MEGQLESGCVYVREIQWGLLNGSTPPFTQKILKLQKVDDWEYVLEVLYVYEKFPCSASISFWPQQQVAELSGPLVSSTTATV